MRRVLLLLACLLSFVSCRWGMNAYDAEKNPVQIARYDHLQYEYVTMNSVSAWQKMNTEYPQVTRLLLEEVLGVGMVNDPQIDDKLQAYYSDSTLLRLLSDAETKFQHLDWLEKELGKGFLFLKKSLPDFVIPKVYAQVSALNQSVVVKDSLVGFSIDKYMGADYPLYKRYYYDYQSRFMNPDRIAPDVLLFYLVSQYPLPWGMRRTLLDVIMHRGKTHWMISKALEYPSMEDELGYTEAEKKWCQKNKRALWKFMVENGHLRATDPMVIRNYTGTAFYFPIMRGETPPSIGIWLGMQLIDEFMKHHKDVSANDLMERTDYREMLQEIIQTF